MPRKRKQTTWQWRQTLANGMGRVVDAGRSRAGWLFHGIAAVLVLGAICVGLGQLKSHVFAQPEYAAAATIRLPERPPWIPAQEVARMIADLGEVRILDGRAVETVAEHLSRSPWVQSVNHVEKLSGGEIQALCQYRRPVAVVQGDSAFYLVDADGIRLPGTYSAPGDFLVIQGVGKGAPQPGEAWPGGDLLAGLRLAELIAPESFAGQVGAISVHNFAGRESPVDAHLALVTRPDGMTGGWGRVLWGSGPGEEIEEPTADQKLRVLRANYQQCGRIDAGAPWIDVSISPGEYHRPVSDSTAHAGIGDAT